MERHGARNEKVKKVASNFRKIETEKRRNRETEEGQGHRERLKQRSRETQKDRAETEKASKIEIREEHET